MLKTPRGCTSSTFSTLEPLEARIAPAILYAATSDNRLVKFDSNSPGVVISVPILGLSVGEEIAGLNFRPATGELYLLSLRPIPNDPNGNADGLLYKVDPALGAITMVGSQPFATDLPFASYGFDFNPVVDRLRIVNSSGQNLRVNPNTGALVAPDTNTSPGSNVDSVAYDRNFDGATATTLFGIDSNSDSLVRIGDVDGAPGSPNSGTVNLIGPLGIGDFQGGGGFDIDAVSGTGYLTRLIGGNSTLYTINLATGAATTLGTLPAGTLISGFTVALPTVKLVNATTATYTDSDGDLVTVKEIGRSQVGSATLPLTAGAGNNLAPFFIGSTGDLRLREV